MFKNNEGSTEGRSLAATASVEPSYCTSHHRIAAIAAAGLS